MVIVGLLLMPRINQRQRPFSIDLKGKIFIMGLGRSLSILCMSDNDQIDGLADFFKCRKCLLADNVSGR